MSLDVAEAQTWSDERLLREYERRVALGKTLTGWLYTSINYTEIETLTEIAEQRHDVRLRNWRDIGIVPTTWTDEFSVVHEWRSTCRNYATPDAELKAVTCLLCVVK